MKNLIIILTFLITLVSNVFSQEGQYYIYEWNWIDAQFDKNGYVANWEVVDENYHRKPLRLIGAIANKRIMEVFGGDDTLFSFFASPDTFYYSDTTIAYTFSDSVIYNHNGESLMRVRYGAVDSLQEPILTDKRTYWYNEDLEIYVDDFEKHYQHFLTSDWPDTSLYNFYDNFYNLGVYKFYVGRSGGNNEIPEDQVAINNNSIKYNTNISTKATDIVRIYNIKGQLVKAIPFAKINTVKLSQGNYIFQYPNKIVKVMKM